MSPLHTRKKVVETRKREFHGMPVIWRRYVDAEGRVRQSWELDDSDYGRLLRCTTKTSGA